MSQTRKKVALVTGGNRGIGLEVCKQLAQQGLRVVLASRSLEKGEQAAKELAQSGLEVVVQQLEVSDESSRTALVKLIDEKFGGADVLVNNAGVFLDKSNENGSQLSGGNAKTLDRIRETLEINTYAAIRMAQLLIPGMKARNYGRIVNVSSGMGQLSDMNGGHPAYRLSKTALNAVTRILADELQSTGIKVNSICPGWVKTDMGGANATRSVEQGADSIVWAATLGNDGPSGGFFRDRTGIPW